MAKKQIDFSEALASSMDSIMNDDDYRSLFDAPKTISASKDPVSDAVETLLLTSQLLDEMGLKKSATGVLETIDVLISEAAEEEDKEDEEEEESDKDEACSDDGETTEVDVSFVKDKDDKEDDNEKAEEDIPPSI